MKQNSSVSDFSRGSIPLTIIRLSLPLMVAQLVQMLYNVIDRIYIGHIPGTSGQALSGLGLTFPVITLIMAFTDLYGSGGVPLFSISRGKGEKDKAFSILGVTFFMLVVSSLVLMVFLYLLMNPILSFLGASADTFPYARGYLLIYLLGTPFVMVSSGMSGFINAQGYSWISMTATGSGVLINALLDPLFIFTFGMGIQGAAWASVLAQLIAFCLVLGFFFTPFTLFRLSRKNVRFSWPLLKKILPLGFSGFVMQATNGIVQAVCNMTLSIYGGDVYIGIMTVLNSLRDLSGGPLVGIRNAAQPVIGYNFGAGLTGRVKKAIWFITGVSVAWQLLVWGLLLLYPDEALSLFTTDPQILALGPLCMTIYFFGFFMMAFQFVGQSVFTGLGFAKPAIFFSIFRKVIIVVPLSFLLPHIAGLGVYGVFLAEPISNFIGGAASYSYMLFTLKTRLRMKENEREPG